MFSHSFGNHKSSGPCFPVPHPVWMLNLGASFLELPCKTALQRSATQLNKLETDFKIAFSHWKKKPHTAFLPYKSLESMRSCIDLKKTSIPIGIDAGARYVFELSCHTVKISVCKKDVKKHLFKLIWDPAPSGDLDCAGPCHFMVVFFNFYNKSPPYSFVLESAATCKAPKDFCGLKEILHMIFHHPGVSR